MQPFILNAANFDGSVMVGNGPPSGTGQRAYRWSAAAGTQDLGSLVNSNWSDAVSVSADGSTIVGTAFLVDGTRRAYRWTATTGMVPLPIPPDCEETVALAVSADGRLCVGASGPSGLFRATLWWADGAVQRLGVIPDHASFWATSASADGSVVVGTLGGSNSRAFIWTPTLGVVDLNEHLQGLGLNTGDWTLSEATGVSADGRVVIGNGLNPCGQPEGWRAVIGGICLADFNEDTNVDPDDLGDFINCYFAFHPCRRADINSDCHVDPDDLGDYINLYFGFGCG